MGWRKKWGAWAVMGVVLLQGQGDQGQLDGFVPRVGAGVQALRAGDVDWRGWECRWLAAGWGSLCRVSAGPVLQEASLGFVAMRLAEMRRATPPAPSKWPGMGLKWVLSKFPSAHPQHPGGQGPGLTPFTMLLMPSSFTGRADLRPVQP